MSDVKLGNQVQVKIESDSYGLTLITGIVVGLGYLQTKPDEFWFQIAGLSSTFYSDEVSDLKVI